MATGKITTFNMDNTVCLGKQQSDLISIISTVAPDIIVVQEAGNTNLRSIIPSTFKTSQVMTNAATKDTAVIWRDSLFNHTSTVQVQALRAESGGTGQHARYFTITTLSNKTGGRVTRVVSANFPEAYYGIGRVYQVPMASNMVRMFNRYKTANFVVGGDFNFDVGVDGYNLSDRTGLSRAFVGPQGFYLTDTLGATSVGETARTNSDHNPVTATITI